MALCYTFAMVNLGELFVPWLVAGLIVVPLVYLERWIHKHLQGLGLLITNDPELAVIIYYIVMLPGVLIHEAGHWIVATVLRVKVKKIRLWPEAQKGGTIRLGLVETVKVDPLRSTLIGLGPLVAGVLVVIFISTTIMDAPAFFDALSTGDLPTIWGGLNELTSTPDFWLWLYLLFSVGNAMMPSSSDRQSWPVVGLGLAGVVGALFLMDLGNLVIFGLEQLVTTAQALTVAFLTALAVDVAFIIFISVLESIIERVVGRSIEYQ